MKNLKQRLSLLLAVVFTVVNFVSAVPAKAIEATPKISFVGVEHSPLVVGDTEAFTVTSDFEGKVQYRAFLFNGVGWNELTNGYGIAVDAKTPYVLPETPAFKLGAAKLSVWVKRAGVKGTKSNANGDFDNYFVSNLNCVNRDNANRVYADGVMDVKQEGLKITINNSDFKGLAGIEGPYKLRLHYFNPTTGQWTNNATEYADKIVYTFPKAGTYVLDVHVNTEKSTTWAKYLLNKNASVTKGTYESWKLKVITVTDKIEEPEVSITQNGTIYGSEDVKTPMQINKNVNITAQNVLFNNTNVKGNVTVTGNNATLSNVKIEGTLFINPGESGNINLNNVTADTIQVLSGATNSIHFNNVNSKLLNVNSKNLSVVVRIEIKGTTNIESTIVSSNVLLDVVEGSFGNIDVVENGTKTESTIELKGTFNKSITVKTKATLKSHKDAKVFKVIIDLSIIEKVTLDGNFNDVEVNKMTIVVITENTIILKITINSSGVTLEMAKDSSITTIDQKLNIVIQIGLGTIVVKINEPVVTQPETPVVQPVINDEGLGATVNIIGNNVTTAVNNINVKDQDITIAIYNINGDLAYIGQEKADANGKVTFTTNLAVGQYSGTIKASQTSGLTKFTFTIVQTP